MASCPILSCSAPAGMTLQLLACLACEQLLTACSCKSPARSSRESLFFLHSLEHFFTLSHSLPLQESHLNIGLLIAKIQVNLVRNKANKMVDKIQPHNFNIGASVCVNIITYIFHVYIFLKVSLSICSVFCCTDWSNHLWYSAWTNYGCVNAMLVQWL